MPWARAILISSSTDAPGLASAIFATTFSDADFGNPSITKADNASSLFLLSERGTVLPSSDVVANGSILSRSSRRMRCAVFAPIPFTFCTRFTSWSSMARESSSTVREESMMRAVVAPTPLTLRRRRNISRSAVEKNPKRR